MQGRRKARKKRDCLQMGVFRFGRVRMGSYEAFFFNFSQWLARPENFSKYPLPSNALIWHNTHRCLRRLLSQTATQPKGI